MKTLRIFMAIGAAVVAAGCAKEINGNVDRPHTRITVGIEDQTRTVFSEINDGKRSILWTNGDKLNINGVTSAPLELEEPAASASFDFEGVLDQPYNTLYPAEIYNDASTVTLPKTVVSQVLPLAGQGLSVKALTAVVRINITKGSHEGTLKKIVFTSKGGVQLCGPFTIDYAAATITGTDASEANQSVELALNDVLGEETLSYYIPVPAGTYGFKVRVLDSKGHYMEKETTSDKELKQGEIFGMTPFAFEPTGTQVDIVVSSAADWNTFAALYNNAPETYGEKVVSIESDIDFAGTAPTTLGNYSEEKYFNGQILGNNHKLSNIVATDVLIGTIGSNCSVSDLTIDETCSYTVAYTPSSQKHFGPFAEYVKGTMENCKNCANISLGLCGDSNNSIIYIGGLVGRIREGVLTNCTNYGKITLGSTYTSSKNTFAGGIVGYISNPDGKVLECSNEGAITTSAISPQVRIGGIAGISYGTISRCTNKGPLTTSLARPSGDACKNILLGGIAGDVSGGTVSSCINKVDITTSSAVKIQFIGGIAADISGTPTLKNNINENSIVSTGGVRLAYYGGLYGRISDANTINVTGTPFTGAISVSGHEDTAYAYIFAGGVVGLATAAVSIIGTDCTLNNNISLQVSSSVATEVMLGGVVGGAGENGSGTIVENAKITIENITTSGNVQISGKGSGNLPKYKKCCLGGILGGAFCGAEISGCASSTKVYFCSSSTDSSSNGNPAHQGGIAGRIEGGSTTVSNCTSSGNIYSYLYNNNWWNTSSQVGINAVGGIIGSFGYNYGNTFTATISNCSSSITGYAYRGTVGGVAGYLSKTTVEECEFTGGISRGAPTSGIVGIANECTVNKCTVKSRALKAQSAGSVQGHTGGIIGFGMNSSVDDCKSFVTTHTSDKEAGGIIGSPDANCTVGTTTACSFGGQVGGVAITADNFASYAFGNTSMTTSAVVTYWNGN